MIQRALWSGAICIVLGVAGVVRADAFWVQTAAGAKPQQMSSVKIVGIEGGQLKYRTASGTDSDRAIDTVAQLQLDDEATLNAAEQAFASSSWDVATDNYLKALRSTTKAWLKPWISKRLTLAAGKANRFDAAVVGYLDSVMQDPAAASANKPALPDEKSTYLTSAVTEINNALANPKLTSAQKQVMLSFLLDVHRARKDQKALADTMAQIMKLSESAGSSASATGAQLARLKLDLASVAIDGKQYQKAIDEITANKAVFVEPQDQADAVFYLAEARYGLAGANKDPQALQDAAIAYMRVVAHFKDAQGQPHVAESLLKTAAIQEALNDKDAAIRLYEQVANQFNESVSGPKAREALDRLKGATTTTQAKPE